MDLDATISLQKHTIDGLRADIARVTNERREYWRERLVADGVLVPAEQLARVTAERDRYLTVVGEYLTALATARDEARDTKELITHREHDIDRLRARAESATCQKATNPSQISSESATPGLRTGNPLAEPVMGGLPRYDGEKLGTPANQQPTP